MRQQGRGGNPQGYGKDKLRGLGSIGLPCRHIGIADTGLDRADRAARAQNPLCKDRHGFGAAGLHELVFKVESLVLSSGNEDPGELLV